MSKNRRISKDEYFLSIAQEVSKRSTCTRRQIGAIIVTDSGEIRSTGYNGNPRGLPHCEDMGCIRDQEKIPSGTRLETCTAVHAEQNALIQAGASSKGGTMYSTIAPCPVCARMIINAQITRVVYSGDYSNTQGLDILRSVGVEISKVDMPGKRTKRDG